jgi:hypothetical protein
MADYPKNNIGREILPLKITNQTGQGNLYFYLVGTTDPDHPDHQWYYLSDFQGNVTLCTPTSGAVSYCMKLGDQQTIQLPRLSAVRGYFSFDSPLQVIVGANGIPSSPAGWVKDMNFGTIFDWVELTWEVNKTDMTLGGNTTQVDMFGLPFELELVGYDADGKPLTVQGGFSKAGVRKGILDAIQASPAPWNGLVIPGTAGGPTLRAIAPYHGMEDLKVFPRNQLDAYITQVWQKYETETLTASVEGKTYLGKVSGGNFVFTPSGGGTAITFPEPDSFMVYTSGPLPTATSTEAGVIMAALQAGFLRSTLTRSTQLPACDSSQYYLDEPVNLYAKIMHQFGTDGGAYAFGFDDVCSKSSFVIVHNPVSGGVTLLGW